MSISPYDPKRLAAELDWLKKHPDFEQRPATIREFVGPTYLNIEGMVRPALLAELENIVGKKVRGDRMTAWPLAMFTGGIGIGKTTIASIILTYMSHWVLCLKDPQKFFKLLPGSRIAFMQMSTSEKQAREVVFGDVKARVEFSPWFQDNYPFDTHFTNQLRFAKDIWILPGDSEETTFEGYNILGGILDEADSHKVTPTKDYAEQGYTTIYSRVSSRFQDRGFLMVIGQMKSATGFAAKKYAEFLKDDKAYAKKMTIWESFGWENYLNPDGSRNSFWYDTQRHEIVPSGVVTLIDNQNLLEIPNTFRKDFENNPEKALRDLAGMPPATGSPFISLTYKISECVERWKARYPGILPPVDQKTNQIEPWFHAPNSLKRVVHIDMAYSGDGDALGIAVGHVSDMVIIEGERKPFITIDLLYRMHAPAGKEIFLGDVRRLIYELRDERRFKIFRATMDGFQSTDTRQQLERRRIFTEIVSVDKTLLPYHDLREAIYENRIAFPPYFVKLRETDTEYTEIAIKELMELSDDGKKVDHPEGGSKDVADAMAGVVYTLMGDRTYHRGGGGVSPVPSEVVQQRQDERDQNGRVTVSHPALRDSEQLRAPIPSSFGNIPAVWKPPSNRRH